VRCDVDAKNLLVRLSYVGGLGIQGDLVGVLLGFDHSVGRWVHEGDDNVGVLRRGVFYGVGNDVGTSGAGREVRSALVYVRALTEFRKSVEDSMAWVIAACRYPVAKPAVVSLI
jgi:hypothetical protein